MCAGGSGRYIALADDACWEIESDHVHMPLGKRDCDNDAYYGTLFECTSATDVQWKVKVIAPDGGSDSMFIGLVDVDTRDEAITWLLPRVC